MRAETTGGITADPRGTRQCCGVIELRRLGYWCSADYPDLPDPNDWVDAAWDEDERDLVARYYRNGTVARLYMGFSFCRLCGVANGSKDLTDGKYLWPEG